MAKTPKKAPLVRKLDGLWSQIIRSAGECERCGTTRTLQCAHNVTRDVRRLRWDARNLMCLCASCHAWWHDYPTTAGSWFWKTRPEDAAYCEQVQMERPHYTAQDYVEMIREAQEKLGYLAAEARAA